MANKKNVKGYYWRNHRIDRVDRVLSFLSNRQYWDSPAPSRAGGCVLPLPPKGSGAKHTRLEERGWGGPNSNEGKDTVPVL